MIYNFKINPTQYYFDGNSLNLFKDSISDNIGGAEIVDKSSDELYKVVFIVANVCNGQCVYCYQQGGNFGHESALMDKASADKSLSYIFDNFNSIGTVSFFGGEATMNFELIKYIVNKLKEKYSVDTYEIFTNATIIDDKMIGFLVKHNFRIKISIDGPDYIHNKLRLNCPHDMVMNTIKKLKKTSIGDKLELDCTYTKYHMEHINFKELIDFFENLGIKYHISNVLTDIDWLKLPKNENEIELMKKSIGQSYERIYSNALNRDISSYATSVLEALTKQMYHEKFCYDVYDGYLTVFDYNGKRSPCVGLLNKCDINNPKIEINNSKNNKVCNACWARGLCNNCIADIITKNEVPPYLKDNCHKKELYAYALESLVRIFQEQPQKFQDIIDNY